MDRALSIGALARQSGTNAPTIRYYEQIGLIRRAERREGGHRTYDAADLKRLTFIRRCREFGFPIHRVRSLLAVFEDRRRSCVEAGDLVQAHLADVRAKLEELTALERSLAQLVDDSERACAGGPGPDCVILEDLTSAARRGRRTGAKERF
jgi:DNA-binding transcriptional MerR regulator